MRLSKNYEMYLKKNVKDFDRYTDSRRNTIISAYIDNYVENIIYVKDEKGNVKLISDLDTYSKDEVEEVYEYIIENYFSNIVEKDPKDIIALFKNEIDYRQHLKNEAQKREKKFKEMGQFLDNLLSSYDSIKDIKDIENINGFDSNNEFINSIVKIEKDHFSLPSTSKEIYKALLKKYKAVVIPNSTELVKYESFFYKNHNPESEVIAAALDNVLQTLNNVLQTLGSLNKPSPQQNPSPNSTFSSQPSKKSKKPVNLKGVNPIDGNLVDILYDDGSKLANLSSSLKVKPSQVLIYKSSDPKLTNNKGVFYIEENNSINKKITTNITIYMKDNWFLFRKDDEKHVAGLREDKLDQYLLSLISSKRICLADLLNKIRANDKENLRPNQEYLFISASEPVDFASFKELYTTYKTIRDDIEHNNIEKGAIVDLTQYVRRMIAVLDVTKQGTIGRGKGYNKRGRSLMLERLMLREDFINYLGGSKNVKESGQHRIFGNRNKGLVDTAHNNDSDPLHAAMNMLEFLYHLDNYIIDDIASLDFREEYFLINGKKGKFEVLPSNLDDV